MENKPLCVDLDNTFFSTDTLWEQFVILFKNSPHKLIGVFFSLLSGKANLKKYIASSSPINTGNYPVNPDVLKFIEDQKGNGRKVYLVTGAHEEIAKDVAKNFRVFDGVYSTTDQQNLTGKRKANLLVETFGDKGFDYIGDSKVDYPVWKSSKNSLIVNNKSNFASDINNISKRFKSPKKGFFPSAIKAMRVYQWAKNALIILPMLLAQDIFNTSNWIEAISAAIFFSFTASSVYIFNDLFDLENDRVHPEKKKRPFAAGTFSIQNGFLLGGLLLTTGVLGSFYVNTYLGLTTLFYLTLNTLYSARLKKVIIIDVFCLGAFYTIRLLAGGFAVGIEITPWLKLFSFFFFSGLGYLKRFSELKLLYGLEGRVSSGGRGYHFEDLPVILLFGGLSTFASVLIFTLYIYQSQQSNLYNRPEVLWMGVLSILYWSNYIWIMANKGKIKIDPVKFVLKDKVSILAGISFVISLAIAAF